ncbi:MAG: nuclear transport factor 2 family protein [Actinomycetota bacterium]
MTSDGQVASKLAIQELCARYCHLLDSGDMDAWQELFSSAAVFEVPAFGWLAQGKEEIPAFIRKILPFEFGDFKHLPSSHAIEASDDGNFASGMLDFQFVALNQQEPVVAMVGYYTDEYVKEGQQWRFMRRCIHPMMVGSALTNALAAKGAL